MKRGIEVTVGAVILSGLVLVFFGTLWLRGSALGREEIEVSAQFREIGQLLRGNPVKLRGVPIGRVDDILLEAGGDGVIVRMKIREGVTLPAEPVAILSPQSMFGDWQVEIHPRQRYPRYDYDEPDDPSVLAGYSLPDFSQLTAVADHIAENLAELTGRVELAFTEETALNVRRAIENIQEVSAQLTALVGSQMEVMDELAMNLEKTTRAVGEAAISVQRAFHEVELAVAGGELTRIVQNIHRATAQVDTLSELLLAAGTEIRGTVGAADSTLRRFETLAERLTPRSDGSLGLLIQDTMLYHQLLSSNLALQSLLEDIKANPRRYLRFTIF